MVLAACIALGVVAIIQALRSRSSLAGELRTGESADVKIAVVFAALTLAYAIAFGFELIGFRIATLVFILSAGALLAGLRPRPMITVTAVGLVVALGTHYVMASLLAVDVP